jgi:hypothetical protein
LPHVDTLIQLTVAHLARYTDVLRVQHLVHSDRGRYSLDTLLNTQHLQDLSASSRKPHLPVPRDRWTKLRNEFVEWPALLSLENPELRFLDERVVRLSEGISIQGIDPPIATGSMLLLKKALYIAPIRRDTRIGWGRPVYALRKGADFLCGHLDRDGTRTVLLIGARDGRRNNLT